MSPHTPHAATLCKGHREDAHGFDILVGSLEIYIPLQAQVCESKGKKNRITLNFISNNTF